MLRIVSYNVHFGKHLANILRWFQKNPRVDVVCFQEFPKDYIALCQAVFPKRAYGYRFTSSLAKRRLIYGELTIFRKKLLHLLSSTHIPLHTNMIDRYSIGGSTRRSCLFTTFRTQRKHCVFANIQLSSLATNARRYAQLRMILRVFHHKKTPCVIIGDYNMSSMLGRRKLFALMKQNFFATLERYIATHRLLFLKHQLDYVFVRKCVLHSMTVVRIRFSDHYPITAEINL